MPPNQYITTRAPFAGNTTLAYVTEFHESQNQESAASWNQGWFLDSRPMFYGGTHGGGTGKITKVSGATNLYYSTNTIHPKIVPTIAACGEHPLLDASPGRSRTQQATTGNIASGPVATLGQPRDRPT